MFEQEYKWVAVDELLAAATVEALLTSCYCHQLHIAQPHLCSNNVGPTTADLSSIIFFKTVKNPQTWAAGRQVRSYAKLTANNKCKKSYIKDKEVALLLHRTTEGRERESHRYTQSSGSSSCVCVCVWVYLELTLKRWNEMWEGQKLIELARLGRWWAHPCDVSFLCGFFGSSHCCNCFILGVQYPFSAAAAVVVGDDELLFHIASWKFAACLQLVFPLKFGGDSCRRNLGANWWWWWWWGFHFLLLFLRLPKGGGAGNNVK